MDIYSYLWGRYKEIMDKKIDLKCCGKTPTFIFKPTQPLCKEPSVSLQCYDCGKEKTMILHKSITFQYDDPVFNESIKILKGKWNE